MDAPALLRLVRSLSGWSQRDLATRLGCSASTVARWEGGGQSPPAGLLVDLLAEVGLQLTTVPVDPPAPHGLLAHLRLPTTRRLHAAFRRGPTSPRLVALQRLLVQADLVLDDTLAVRVWVPGPPVEVAGARYRWSPLAPRPRRLPPRDLPGLDLREDGALDLRGLVPVSPGGRRTAHVPRPEVLAGRCGDLGLAVLLRQAARALAGDAARDPLGRRAPAHRAPDERHEQDRLTHARYAQGPRPRATDSRAFRLDGTIGLRRWSADQALAAALPTARRRDRDEDRDEDSDVDSDEESAR